MFRNKIEKRGAKFPSTTLGHSRLRISHHDDAFSSVLQLEASTVEDHKLQQKKHKKGEKGRKTLVCVHALTILI